MRSLLLNRASISGARRARAASSSGARGFTLIELMVVVIVVSLLAAMAVPSMIRARDDRHAYNNSQEVAQLLRAARLRAIGRGGAVAVSMTASGSADRGTFQAFEAVTANPTSNGTAPTDDANNRTPIASCLAPNWSSAPPTGNALPLDGRNFNFNLDVTLDFQTSIKLNYVDRTGTQNNAGVAAAWVCFTPAGRAYVSSGGTPAFNAGNQFIDLDICMMRGGLCPSGIGLQRHVLVPPAGVARLYSR